MAYARVWINERLRPAYGFCKYANLIAATHELNTNDKNYAHFSKDAATPGSSGRPGPNDVAYP